MRNTAIDALLTVGGLFLWGVRGYVSKWMVITTFKIAKILFIRTKRDIELYMHFYEEATKKLK